MLLVVKMNIMDVLKVGIKAYKPSFGDFTSNGGDVHLARNDSSNQNQYFF